MESEIFGHVKGRLPAPRGSRGGQSGGRRYPLLDEICEMDLDLQSKLLRFIQTGTLQRVGSGKLETVDVRFVCATNRDPGGEVKAGRFREDLYYRLRDPAGAAPWEGSGGHPAAGRELQVRCAGERRTSGSGDFDDAVVLLDHPWPGNVRELQNVVQHSGTNDGELVSLDIPATSSTWGRTWPREPAVGIADPQSESVVVRRSVRSRWRRSYRAGHRQL